MKHKKFIITVAGLIIIGGILAIWQFTTSPASAMMTEDEAREKVSTQFTGDIVQLELDDEDNKKVYEIEIKGSDRFYDLTIDAETGEVLKLEENMFRADQQEAATETANDNKDNKNDNNDNNKADESKQEEQQKEQKNKNNATDKKTLLSADEASAIALQEYDGKITDLELDDDDGRQYYEIEIVTDEAEIDLEIDAYTGEIVSISQDLND
ncbi:PepSY domain-containing protein [Gracilibacillus alcaliphilus]|uniref:PepSY domain-containing protein n=1 Tax=Gracilibacillus alcaliphilus TaxID=1401441 RepID=UPI00195AEDCD|nr:PepSY domain-containing protein [Gracilibacillus alcaliphilus]MBM7677655.1 putative membrane protein YkoI [Gracilibacillus alcaliphilus]